jgi:hypothetical protein
MNSNSAEALNIAVWIEKSVDGNGINVKVGPSGKIIKH